VLGSVSQHVAAYAKCPVTVVRWSRSRPGVSPQTYAGQPVQRAVTARPGGRGPRRRGRSRAPRRRPPATKMDIPAGARV